MRITSYEEFQAFNVSTKAAEELCRLNDLPRPKSIRRLGRGEVNAVFEVISPTNSLVLKVGVRDHDVSDLQREHAIIGHFQETSEIPVPMWTKVNHNPEVMVHPYMFMESVDGLDGDTLWVNLGDVQRQRVLQHCGKTLRSMHSTTVSEALLTHLGEAPSSDDWAHHESEAFRRALEDLRSQGWISVRLLRTLESVWNDYRDVLTLPFDVALLHYDFQLHNLRIDSDSLEIVGVLDWDNACLGPDFTDARSLELNLFLSSPELRPFFWDGYGKRIGPDHTKQLKLHMMNRALQMFVSYRGPLKNYSETDVENFVRSI